MPSWTRENAATPSRVTIRGPARRCVRAAGALSAGSALLLASVLLNGCAPPADAFAPACPQLKLLRDGADLTQFTPRGHDVTDMQVAARIVAVPAVCAAAKQKGEVEATIHVNFDVRRGPALPGRSASVPYFVAIMDGDRLLQRQSYATNISFPANTDRVSVSGDDIDMLFPVTPTKGADTYTIYVSFQLTPDQLAYNRSNPVR